MNTPFHSIPQIRQAVLADLDSLVRLRIQMREERETMSLQSSPEEFQEMTRNFFMNGLANGSFLAFVAEENGVLVATSGLCFHHHLPTYEVPTGLNGYILNMYTLPEYRGRGLARQLLDRMIQEAREKGCTKVLLNASEMGKSVYLRYGFREVENEMMLDL